MGDTIGIIGITGRDIIPNPGVMVGKSPCVYPLECCIDDVMDAPRGILSVPILRTVFVSLANSAILSSNSN